MSATSDKQLVTCIWRHACCCHASCQQRLGVWVQEDTECVCVDICSLRVRACASLAVQAAFTAGAMLPKPFATCRYWHRSLSPKKLIDIGFSRLAVGAVQGWAARRLLREPKQVFACTGLVHFHHTVCARILVWARGVRSDAHKWRRVHAVHLSSTLPIHWWHVQVRPPVCPGHGVSWCVMVCVDICLCILRHGEYKCVIAHVDVWCGIVCHDAC